MKVNRIEYFNHLAELLDSEKMEDKLHFEVTNEVSSIPEKVADGKCWYPTYVSFVSSWNNNEYLLCLRRADLGESRSVFHIGASVRIYNNKLYENQNHSIQGIITRIDEQEMRVNIDSKAYKDYQEKDSWLNKDDLAVEQTYNRKSYEKMLKALRRIQNKPDETLKRLSEILMGDAVPAKKNTEEDLKKYNIALIEDLNKWQKRAIFKVIQTEDVAMILGPPGTGKTTTISYAIKLIVEAGLKEEKILVTAPSNTAVDLLAIKLHRMGGINVLRLGNAEKINKDAAALTLDGKIECHPDFLLLDNISNRIQNRFDQIRNQPSDKAELQRLNEEDIKIRNKIYKSITKEIFKKTQVVACTLEKSVAPDLKKFYKSKFKYGFIDEAGQALEPMCWLPVIRSKKIVMIGDHHQLPPVVKSVEIFEGALKKSLFEKVMENGNVPHQVLSRQYRMHEKIMNFSNGFFYDNQLEADDKNRFQTLLQGSEIHQWNTPFEFVDTAECGFDELKIKAVSSSSTINKKEGAYLVRHLEAFIEQISQHQREINLVSLTIGVITPYRQQLYFLESEIASSEIIQNFPGKVSCNTVDGYQGQEQDVIYISLVRSNKEQTIGFLKEYRRMNVAITRAKKKVVIIGNSKTLGADEFYQKLIAYAKKEKFYFDARQLSIEIIQASIAVN